MPSVGCRDPSGWDLHTLQSLGPLVLALNQTTLSLVAKVSRPQSAHPSIGANPRPRDPAPSALPWQATREAFARSIAATYSSQGWSQREKSLTLLSAFAAASAASHPRLKRSADREPFPSLWILSVAQRSWGEKSPQGGGEDRQKVESAHKGTGEVGEMWEMFLLRAGGCRGGSTVGPVQLVWLCWTRELLIDKANRIWPAET